jgi:hypothetical protein
MMRRRAEASGVALDHNDAAVVKGMLARGDRQHDIAAWFGVNGGRIAEIAIGAKFSNIAAASATDLPPPGPYLSGRQAHQLFQALLVNGK